MSENLRCCNSSLNISKPCCTFICNTILVQPTIFSVLNFLDFFQAIVRLETCSSQGMVLHQLQHGFNFFGGIHLNFVKILRLQKWSHGLGDEKILRLGPWDHVHEINIFLC